MMTLELSAVSLERKIVKYDFNTFKRVRDIITRADMPASNRKSGVGVAQIPSFSIDPIVSDFVGTINRLWSSIFFSPGVSWVDLDDDKLWYSSPNRKHYGFRMITTQDQKQKPGVHCMASVGAA